MSVDKSLLNRHFVPARASDNFSSSEAQCGSVLSESTLSADEVSSFYQSVLNTPSTSTACCPGKTGLKKASTNNKSRVVLPDNQNNPQNSDRLQRRFLAAAQHGDLSDLISCIERGVSIDCIDRFSWSALMVASFAGHASLVETLLRAGANPRVVEGKGLNARDLAASNGRIHVVKCIDDFVSQQTDSFSCHRTNSSVSEDGKPQYCRLCRMEFTDSLCKHSNSLLHQMEANRSSAEHLGNDGHILLTPRNRGYQLLLQGGWTEGSGLGPQGQGRKGPIRTILKRNRFGLGCGPTEPARISHFDPGDAKAVESETVKPLSSSIKMDNRFRDKRMRKEKNKEKSFRMQFYEAVESTSSCLYGGK